jgi:glucose/arabinose dehydrogenase
MMPRKKSNNPRTSSTACFSLHIGLLAAISILLAACGARRENAALPTISPLSTPTVPATQAAIQTPAESTTTPAPTTLPTALTTFPNPDGYAWGTVISGLQFPVDVQNAADGSGRLFIVEKRGCIRILQNNQILPTPFLDIQGEVGSQHSEQGLLGLAFHPDFARSGAFFVNYTDLEGNTVIARFQVSPGDPNRVDASSQVNLLQVDQPYVNHNGGGLAFGPDGYLYIGLGDGGSGGDPLGNGQNLQTMLGKLLRIDIDHGEKYSIPADNPFSQSAGLPEIWMYGLRNPWRFSFDRLTGDMFIADVGQDAWEELDFVAAGSPGGMDLGWSYYEGTHPYKGQPPANIPFTWPVMEYSHADGCSITGGYVYHGTAMPEWQGVYFFGDYCSGNIWGLIRPGAVDQQSKILFTTRAQITTFGLGEAGEIYMIDYGSGTLLRLQRKQ